MEKLFIICTFDCSFQYYEQTVKQWVKEQGGGIVINYELVKLIIISLIPSIQFQVWKIFQGC